MNKDVNKIHGVKIQLLAGFCVPGLCFHSVLNIQLLSKLLNSFFSESCSSKGYKEFRLLKISFNVEYCPQLPEKRKNLINKDIQSDFWE